ncbi:glutathione S-transferase GstA [Kalaharituber pfeilii]|nr:glutathione S-transferase GstA [Kalaharituber pfeilii]
MSKQQPPVISLYTVNTPNGVKISIALEELGLSYNVHVHDFSKNTQKEPWFLEINPNGRIPAITDHSFRDGAPIHVFESGAILEYLTERYDPEHKISYPHGTREYWEQQQWLFFQNAGVGPMQGQANHFKRYAPEQIPYGINRYVNETKRLYSVLEARLARPESKGYLVGDHVSIADITCYGWVRAAAWAGVDIDEFPKLKEWEERLEKRPAFQKGVNTPAGKDIKALAKDTAQAEEEAAQAREWVQRGMKEQESK